MKTPFSQPGCQVDKPAKAHAANLNTIIMRINEYTKLLKDLFLVDGQRRVWLQIRWAAMRGMTYNDQWEEAVKKHAPNNIEHCRKDFFRLCCKSWKWWFTSSARRPMVERNDRRPSNHHHLWDIGGETHGSVMRRCDVSLVMRYYPHRWMIPINADSFLTADGKEITFHELAKIYGNQKTTSTKGQK